MSEDPQPKNPRSLRRDLFALGLFLLTVLLGASLMTYSPSDPPGTTVSPPNTDVANACGWIGATLSHWMFQTFGLGAFYVLISLALFDASLLLRRKHEYGTVRSIGWGLSLWGVCTFAAMAGASISPGPAIGPGGYFGAASAILLQANFASLGAYALTLSVIFGGLLLCSDTIFPFLLRWTVGVPALRIAKQAKAVVDSYWNSIEIARGLSIPDPDVPNAGVLAMKRLAASKRRPLSKATDVDDDTTITDEQSEERRRPTIHAPKRPKLADSAEAPDDPVKKPANQKSTAAKAPAEANDDTEAEQNDGKRSLFSFGRKKEKTKSEREEILEQLDSADQVPETDQDYQLPDIGLLDSPVDYCYDEQQEALAEKAVILEETFASFGFNVEVRDIHTGPVIAQFEISLEAGLRLSKITGLADDLAIALCVPSVRIVAPLPGKNTVGIEVPHEERQVVCLREVIEEADEKAAKMAIPIYLGKNVSGEPLIVDLTKMPHLLIAGRTGTGKSVCLNAIIISMLMMQRPDEVRMLMIDPKMVELSPYKQLPHLMHPVVTDMKKAEAILAWAVDKMEERYKLLARAGVRHISSYNQLGDEELMERLQPETDEERRQIPLHIPYIVIVADEMADLMMTSAKEVEQHIIRLAQKSRAVGIHLVLATQKPTVDVITGLIKSNLPARIAFQVASRTDSRVVLDEMGADRLLGNGDMLLLWPGTSNLIRGQGTYLSDDEISRVIGQVATTEPHFVKELVHLKTRDQEDAESDPCDFKSRDELYEQAVEVIIREGRGSVSLLQRALGVGYGRGARLIDYMAEDGIVGTYNGSQAREVLMTLDAWDDFKQQVAVAASNHGGNGKNGNGQLVGLTTTPAALSTVPMKLVDRDTSADDPHDVTVDSDGSDTDEDGEVNDDGAWGRWEEGNWEEDEEGLEWEDEDTEDDEEEDEDEDYDEDDDYECEHEDDAKQHEEADEEIEIDQPLAGEDAPTRPFRRGVV